MGRRRDSSICCLAPKPTVKAPPAAISAAPGWPTQIPSVRQINTGTTKMRSARKDCAFQSKTRLSVRKGEWDAGDCVDIFEAALSQERDGLSDIRALPSCRSFSHGRSGEVAARQERR